MGTKVELEVKLDQLKVEAQEVEIIADFLRQFSLVFFDQDLARQKLWMRALVQKVKVSDKFNAHLKQDIASGDTSKGLRPYGGRFRRPVTPRGKSDYFPRTPPNPYRNY